MKTLARLILLAATLLAGNARAEERVTLGWGRLFTNDALGDGEDRWNTGSYAVSKVMGLRWGGQLPDRPGEIWEYRFSANTIAPANLIAPDPSDRLYAGALSLGATTYFDLRGFDVSLGGGLTFIGPSTGLGQFQSAVHEILGLDVPTSVLDDQLPDQIHAVATAEIVRDLALGPSTRLRPFVAVRAGTEDLLRVGADLIIGGYGKSDLLLRDAITGHLVRGVSGDSAPQFSLLIGADRAQVFSSVFLPEGGAAVMTPQRDRIRAGYFWQGKSATAFSGLTWLSPEFDAQPDGQILGSFSLSFSF